MATKDGAHESSGPLGGASGDAGVEYRRAVAAFAISFGLAGESLPGFGFSVHDSVVNEVALETDEVVDDVSVTYSGGRRSLIQAKRSLKNGATFAKACQQWGDAARRGFDADQTRLVIVGAQASGPIKTLQRTLERHKVQIVGKLTDEEEKALARLRGDLGEVTDDQFNLVLRAGVIRVLDVEEEESADVALARSMLRHVSIEHSDTLEAWRLLLAVAGRVARVRGGFSIRGWTQHLIEHGLALAPNGSAGAKAARELEALETYRSALERRGSYVDLRSLGAACSPIPLEAMDGEVECSHVDDDHDSEDLMWSIIRRHRVILTGLPGGGKTTALASAAARMCRGVCLPLPLIVPLRKVVSSRVGSFADRLLDVAVEDLPDIYREVVRAELSSGLRDGSTCVILDGLDETHDQRGATVSEIETFVGAINHGVPVLLATRSVAYAQASSLGWDQIELGRPSNPERVVGAVLRAVAQSRSIEEEEWVSARLGWVTRAMQNDPALAETALMPVLLALLATDLPEGSLPESRARALEATVEAAVRRYESARAAATLPGFDSASSTEALLGAFKVEAALLAEGSGNGRLHNVVVEIARYFETDWDVVSAKAKVAALKAAHFWDEMGVFVIQHEDVVQPRSEILLDIGDALAFQGRSDGELKAWVELRVEQRRLEPVVLASAISEVAARALVDTCESVQEHAVLGAAIDAMKQGALFTPEMLVQIEQCAQRDVEPGDQQGWDTLGDWFAATGMLGAPVPPSWPDEVVANFPTGHQLIARLAGRVHTTSGTTSLGSDSVEMLTRPRRATLPVREGFNERSGFALLRRDSLRSQALQAAVRHLIGLGLEGAEIVAGAIGGGQSRGTNRDLSEALAAAGFGHLAPDREPLDARTLANTRALIEFATNLEPAVILPGLRRPELETAQLSPQEGARLDILASVFEVLNLKYASGWPAASWREDWIDVVNALLDSADVDRARLNSELDIMDERLRVDHGDLTAFWALGIAESQFPRLTWAEVHDQSGVVSRLSKGLYLHSDTARVVAWALAHAPAELAVPVLRDAVSKLTGNREHQYVAAKALVLQLELVPGEWSTADSAALREVDTEFGEQCGEDGLVHPRLRRALVDRDRDVARAAVEAISQSSAPDALEVLGSFVETEAVPWNCARCGRETPGAARSCAECRIVEGDPRETARELVSAPHGTPQAG